MERRYPCLFECRDGTVYLVLVDPLKDGHEARSAVLRLDGEPTGWADTTKVFTTLTMDALDSMGCAWRDY